MRFLLKAVSYLFHPILIPVAGTIAYFLVTPSSYNTLENQMGNLLPISILTVVIPIIFFLILKNLGVVKSIFLNDLKERKYPLYVHGLLLILILYKVLPNNYINELFFYFVGLLLATGATIMLLFLKIKTSLHLVGMGSLLMYLVALSLHYEINLTMVISLFTVLTGLVASSRLYLKAHGRIELLIGFIVGAGSQLMLFKFWL